MGDLNWSNYFAALMKEAKELDAAMGRKKMEKNIDSVPEVRWLTELNKDDKWEYDVHDLLNKAAREYEILQENYRQAREQLRDINKEALLQVERERAEEKRTHSLHLMSDAEYKANQEFRRKHYNKCHNGNHFIYELYGTGIGETIKVTCAECGETLDITDVDSW